MIRCRTPPLLSWYIVPTLQYRCKVPPLQYRCRVPPLENRFRTPPLLYRCIAPTLQYWCWVPPLSSHQQSAPQESVQDISTPKHRGARHRFSHIAATLQRRDGENGSSSGAVGLSCNYEDVGTGDDSTSVRGSSGSVLNHGRQQGRNVLRQTSSTIRRRLSRQMATKAVMYSFTLLVTYLPVFGVFYFPHNQAVHMTVSLVILYTICLHSCTAVHMKTTYGRWVRTKQEPPCSSRVLRGTHSRLVPCWWTGTNNSGSRLATRRAFGCTR